MYRARVEIHDSIFRGNDAVGLSPAGADGAISISSQDSPSDSQNFPSAELTVRDSLFQGRWGGAGSTGNQGGCIWSLGDTARSYGVGSATPMGSPAINRTKMEISGLVFADCDVEREDGVSGTGVGGALSLTHTQFTIYDSLFIDNDATGTFARGGAIRMINETLATITETTFANNFATFQAGAISASGSDLEVDNCQFINNDAPDGSAITTSVASNVIAGGIDFSALGEIKNSVFSDHPQKTLREFDDDDSECEINEVVYNNNQFFTQPVDSDVFQNNRANTVKSTVDNVVLSGEPDLGGLVAVPPQILPRNAAGDPPPPTEAFLAYGWGGSSATLDGVPLANGTGLQTTTAGQHTLVVGSATSVVASVANGPAPNANSPPSRSSSRPGRPRTSTGRPPPAPSSACRSIARSRSRPSQRAAAKP